MYMVMLVLNEMTLLDKLLAVWKEAGVTGSTILETTGAFRRSQVTAIGARYIFGGAGAYQTSTVGNVTLFSIVHDEATVQRCLQATETVTGNLDEPNTGIFAAWPLPIVKGGPGHDVAE
ncbi:MAG: hypothetical protein OHK0046_44730 [Anaerolineae bacterium]